MNRCTPTGKTLAAALSVALAAVGDASAVYLDPEGVGQALIYPYYTTRSTNGNAFNTYLSVVNATGQSKVARVRVREGRNGREVAGFNLYLGRGDVWAAALVPTPTGATLITADASCTDPGLQATPTAGVREIAFSNAGYSGAADDGLGASLDRTREGYVEIIEMASLSGAIATAVTHNAAGVPINCAVSQMPGLPLGMFVAPTGSLSGTLTLINVADGRDFTVNAVALADLTTQPFYRHYSDPYPDFDAAEVTPVSHVTVDGRDHRLEWPRGLDAVSSVLMSEHVINESVGDAETASRTDWVLTFPTRRLHVTPAAASAPFSQATPGCETLSVSQFDREAATAPATRPIACHATTVIPMRSSHQSLALGSTNLLSPTGPPAFSSPSLSGWARLGFAGERGLRSDATSTTQDLATGVVTSDAQVIRGLPATGFAVRTFDNGTLNCSTGSCQGNYGGSFPHRYRRNLGGGGANVVSLDPDGLGQALVYPYYTTRSVGGNAFNTYLSVVNTTAQAKVARVRIREGKAGASVLDFNLYLSANDAWTAAIVPTAGGARLLTADRSCTNPQFFATPAPGVREVPFNNFAYTGAFDDGLGTSLDRTREGYVEIIEMGTLVGAAQAAVAPGGAGGPANCAAVQAGNATLAGQVAAPTGGLAGTLTLIDVGGGRDFTVNAEALANLTAQPFYRDYGSPYPDFDASEVTTASHALVDGMRVRMRWSGGVDAVSSVLMQAGMHNEFVLDAATQSNTDHVLTFPTRRFHVRRAASTPPFAPVVEGRSCQAVEMVNINRNQASFVSGCDFEPDCSSVAPSVCWASTVIEIEGNSDTPEDTTRALGSVNRNRGRVHQASGFVNGWNRAEFIGPEAYSTGLAPITGSSRDLRTGIVTAGPVTRYGLPAVGFMVRTFTNGTLSCATGRCQGNYGGAFPHHPARVHTPFPFGP